MKTTIRIAIILSAFFIGVTINNSCGDLPNNKPNGSIDTGNPQIDALLNSMQSEITELKSKVTTLENSSGGTEVDGMFVGPYGIANKTKKFTSYLADGSISFIQSYEYDNYGRMSSYSVNSNSSTYTYQYKKVTQTNTSTGKVSTVTEYY